MAIHYHPVDQVIEMGSTTTCKRCGKTWNNQDDSPAPQCVPAPDEKENEDLALGSTTAPPGRLPGDPPKRMPGPPVMVPGIDKPGVRYADNNPKTRMGALKIPLHLVPPSARYYMAMAFEDGERKYGPFNWRDEGVSTSVYIDALDRHRDAFWDGEDLARDSKVHHLGHIMACCAIILDAMECGTLNDDRPTPGPATKLQERYLEIKK